MYVSDHLPAHVHVVFDDGSVVFLLDSAVSIRDQLGRVKFRDVSDARRLTRHNLMLLRKAWNEIHPDAAVELEDTP